MSIISIHPDVEHALADNRPVVALESAVITAGMPREPLSLPPALPLAGFRSDQPCHTEVAALMERTVREAGAQPATIAILDGVIRIGLTEDELKKLGNAPPGVKASARDLALRTTDRVTAGATVSATIAVCALARPRPIRVMATGGIGGVHRGYAQLPDVSADLGELAQTPICVVASGVKSILDVSATLEALESLRVPVVSFGCDHFPMFFSSDSTVPTPSRRDSVGEIARVCRTHWGVLGRREAVVVANPPPEGAAVDGAEIERIVARDLRDGSRAVDESPANRTPRLLETIARDTAGRSVVANIALLAGNARLAAQIVAEICRQGDASELGSHS